MWNRHGRKFAVGSASAMHTFTHIMKRKKKTDWRIGWKCKRRTYRQLRDVVRNQEVPVCTGPVHDEANDLFRCADAKATSRRWQ